MGLRETLVSASGHATEARAWLQSTHAAELLHGAERLEEEEGGWVRPLRFGEPQERALSSCMAWHPGLYRQMARATAGVCVRFVTDATEVALAIRLDSEPSGTRRVLRELDQGRPRREHDGVSAVVDGRGMGCVFPEVLARPLPWVEGSRGMGLAFFDLSDPHEVVDQGVCALPGLGARHDVCIWLPCLRGCRVRELWSNGTFLQPVAPRRRLLVLGDSVAQGFCADDPALAWPVALSERLGMDLLNQSVGGQVFQPSSLLGAPRDDIGCLVIALGANYRWEACGSSAVTLDVRAFIGEAARAWPDVPAFVVTPLWHDEVASPSDPRSCWRDVPSIVRVAARAQGLTVVGGSELMEHEADLLADVDHPNARGHAQIAERLGAVVLSALPGTSEVPVTSFAVEGGR